MEGAPQQRIEQEKLALLAAGFEPDKQWSNLWRMEGVWFGRKAALQKVGPTLVTNTEGNGSARQTESL